MKPVERRARYRAPADDGEKLSVPPWNEIDALVAANVAWRQRHDPELLGRPLSDLTAAARREALGATESSNNIPNSEAASGPWIVTGHQPGLIHPGVWVKNFAAAQLAAAHGGVGLHVVIDADVCRTPAILVPSGSVDSPRAASVEFDRPAAVTPWEERRILDEQLWRSFPERVHEAGAQLLADPFLDEWWPTAVARGAETGLVGAALAAARHDAEVAWGCQNLELPQSRLCQTDAFRWFACTLLADLPRFAAAYNAAVGEYRTVHHIRNHAHPVPNLAADGGWLEAPFWVWSTSNATRRPVFVQATAGGLLVSDRRHWEAKLPLTGPGDAPAAVAEVARWEAAGVKLRSRALITTMFTRLVVADLFIHGIGGAKYDEVTDAIAERYFGAAPPAFAAMSGTLRLAIPHAAATDADVQRLRNGLRELKFHPERKLDFSGLDATSRRQAELLAAEKSRWVRVAKTPANAAERHRGINAANDALQPLVSGDRANLQWQIGEAVERAKAGRVLESREYAACLFPRKRLEYFLLDFSAGAR